MSDPIVDDCDQNKTDLMKISGNLISNINYKLAFFMFVIGMFIFSDIFIDSVLSTMNGAVDGDCPTTQGTIVQLIIFCLIMLFLDILIKYNWL